MLELETLTNRFEQLEEQEKVAYVVYYMSGGCEKDYEEFDDLDSANLFAEINNGTVKAAGGLDSEEEREELARLKNLLKELKGGGGDYQWRGDWYPQYLIPEEDFIDYIKEHVSDCYTIPDQWPFNCLDWKQVAKEARVDYSSIDYEGQSYLYR